MNTVLHPLSRFAVGFCGFQGGAKSHLASLQSTTAACLVIALAVAPLCAARAQSKAKSTIGTLGTDQMKGGEGRFGVTYTFSNGLNASLVRAEYSIARYNIDKGTSLVPKAGEKLLILHWKIKNANPTDTYVSGTAFPFSTVAADGQTRNHNDYLRLTSSVDPLNLTLKPGQALPEEVVGAGIVPADGPVTKLIINLGRKGTTERVTRFALGSAPNIVKPLAAVDADPADKSGATALTSAPAKIGVIYPLGSFDVQASSIAFVPGPIGTKSAGTGKRYLVATVSMTNKTQHQVYTYFQYLLPSALLTADDETTKDVTLFKGKRDEPAEEKQVDPGETITVRMAFIVPNGTTGKKLTLAEGVDNSGGKSRALVFDLSGVK